MSREKQTWSLYLISAAIGSLGGVCLIRSSQQESVAVRSDFTSVAHSPIGLAAVETSSPPCSTCEEAKRLHPLSSKFAGTSRDAIAWLEARQAQRGGPWSEAEVEFALRLLDAAESDPIL
jgi:hypothetical protein